MSQPFIDKTESSSGAAPNAPLPACSIRGAWRCLATRALQSLLVCLGLVCAAAMAAFAQQAQIVKSAQTITCDGKNYQLRLVAAEAPISGNNAKALGVVLTRDNTASSKVFCLYWINATTPSPTHRDSAKGIVGERLIDYGNGMTDEKKPADRRPAIEAFFAGAKCASADSQVIAVEDQIRSATATKSLHDVVNDLKSRGVAFGDGKIEDDSAGSRTWFAGLQSGMEFAKAIRRYVDSVLAAEGRSTGAAGSKLLWENEKNQLIAQKTGLEEKLKELLAEKDSTFGGAPIWLISAFFAALAILLTVVSLAYYSYRVIGLAYYSYYNNRALLLKGGSRAEIEKPDLSAEIPSVQSPQPLNILWEITRQSNDTLDRIERKYSGLWQTDETKSQGKGHNVLAQTVLVRLDTEKLINLRNYSSNYNKVREILKEVLGEDLDNLNPGGQYRQCVEEWRDAYVALYNRVVDFRDGLASSEVETTGTSQAGPSLPGGTDMELVVQNIPESLSILVKELTEVKNCVRGFDRRLGKYLEVSQSLQHIWRLWYGKNYHDGERMDTFVEDVGAAISVFQSLERQVSKQKLSVADTRGYWEFALEDLCYVGKHYLDAWQGESTLLPEVTNKIRTKMGDDAKVAKKYDAIEMSLRSYFRKNVEAPTAVESLIKELSEAMEKLGEYHSDRSNFTETIDAVMADYRAVAGQVHRALPGAKGSMTGMAGSLATEYLKLEPEAKRARQLEAERDNLQGRLTTAHLQLESSKELVEEIALQLNYKADQLKEDEQAIVLALSRLRKERKSSVYQQLRMGLSAALIALEKATGAGGSAEQAEVIEALYLDKVKKGVKALLAEMEEYVGDRLWSVGLTTGFSQKWLHYLLRADLLLRAYYTGKQDFRLMREAVSLACSSIQAALYELNVDVTEIGLFEPLPQGIETEPVYPSLRNLPTVRDRVRRKLQSLDNGEVVVDVTSFPYRVGGEQRNPGRVSLVNPSAWLQN